MAFRFLFFLVSLCAALWGSSPVLAKQEGSPPLQVLVSIAPQKFLLERIAGDAVSTIVLVNPGADPHTYEPLPSQLSAAASATLWFTIGVPFEDIWTPRITASNPKLKTVLMSSGIQRLPGEGHTHHEITHEEEEEGEHTEDHMHTGEDPHVWLSPMLVRGMLPVLTRELCRLVPERAAEFRSRAKALDSELEALDAKLALAFKPFPPEQRVFLTFHPSWRYFAANYQLTELSIEVDGKEPGPKKLQEITTAAKKYGITTVFVEPQFPKNAARAIAEALGATIVVSDPLTENLLQLYSDMTEKLVRSFQR